MSSKTAIANMALRRMGVTQLIANVDTENSSKAAVTIRDAWDAEVDFVLRSWPWPWARGYATLALVDGEVGTPVTNDWTFAYRYPPEAFVARRIVPTGGRALNMATPGIPWSLGRDDQGRLIYTDEASAVLEYTARITDPEEFDPLFVSLLAWRLVVACGVGLSRLEKIEDRALRMFLMEHRTAAVTSANEGQEPAAPDADWITGRN